MAGADDARWRVFVSHTSELREFPADLSYVRAVEQAISACGHVVVDMGNFPSADLPPAEFCVEQVRSCDVYVGVLGTRYGSPVRDLPDLSYTELEFDAALEAGLDRLVFMLDTGARDVGIPLDRLIDPDFGARQQAFRQRVQDSGLLTQQFSSPEALGRLVERSLRDLADRRRAHAGVIDRATQAAASQHAESQDDARTRLRAYLEMLAERYQWLELQGIREAGSLRIELEKVYVALKAEPESEYDLRHLANLHSLEVREAAGGASLDLIDPTLLAALDAENVRRTYQPQREEARRASVTDVKTIADAFRLSRRMVLLGGPGSGKTTLGHWLALQLARGLLRQLPQEVAPESGPALPNVVRFHVPAGATTSFARSQFAPLAQADKVTGIRIDALPARGTLALSGTPGPVTAGQVVKIDQLERLTFTPVEGECASGYAHLQFSVIGETMQVATGAIALDVGVHMRVPLSQVDPDHGSPDGTERFVDLGPARIPIFLRLAHFARELAERERNQRPALSLEEYLGCDPDSRSPADGCTPESRNALLRQFLDDGKAVVILDGLDELPEANRRTISLKIQDFIEKFSKANPANESEVPWQSGGNQVIVTSRYVGYKLMPVRSGCAHFGIQAMQRPAVEHFARAWTAAVNAELGPEGQERLAADALIAEIYDNSRPAIRELATNPLLVTILAIVYWADGRLPDQRAGLYDRVVENLLRIWLKRPECQAHALVREELLAALEPLAAEMQENSGSNGLIGLDRIGELIEKPLALMRKSSPADRSFRPVLDALLTTIRHHVGLLAEQSDGNYAFFHRTFQEFLAARYLLSDREHAAERIVERLDDPHWREPLLLALGLAMISPEWGGPKTRAQLLEAVLAGDDLDPLIPRAATLLVNALPGLKDVPRPVVGQVVRQLLKCYAFSQSQSQAEGLRDGICQTFVRLRHGPQADVVSETISKTIGQPPADRDYSAAAAQVLLRIDWFTTETVDALLQVVHRDQAGLGWPVRWTLLAAIGQSADDVSWWRPAPSLNMSGLVANHLPMRRLLESSPELTAFIRRDIGWLWLLVALYGGVGHAQIRERLRSYQRERLHELHSVANGSAETAGPPPAIPPIEFCPADIVHDLADTELSRTIQRHLRARKPPGQLAETFRQVWERETNPACCADAIVGLAALGEDVVPLIRSALAEEERQPSADAALGRFRWLRSLLQEPLLRSTETAARTLPDEASEWQQLDLLRIVIEARTACGGGPLQVSDTIPDYRLVNAASDEVRDLLAAEYWAYVFSGLSDAGQGDVSAVLGAVSNGDPRSVGRLIRGWSELCQARNHLARLRLAWPQLILAPRCETPTEHYLAMLDELVESPAECAYLAGHLLGRCKPLLSEAPALIWETLAICCSRGHEFVKGYLAGATGEVVLSSACSSVTSDFVAAWEDYCPGKVDVEGLRAALRVSLLPDADDVPDPRSATSQARFLMLLESSRITDPYLRFRAQWRTFDTLRHDQVVPLPLDVRMITEIAEPHDQVRALEWIMLTVPDKGVGPRVSQIFDLAALMEVYSRIADPENRARAQCRLALFAPERLDELLGAAVASVDQIADPERKAETISDIRASLGGVPSLAQALDTVADALGEPWLRNKARGRTSRLLAAYRRNYGIGALAWRLPPEPAPIGADRLRLSYPTGHLAWGLLYLNAMASEVGALETTPTGSRADWELLVGTEWRAGVDGLIESAADGGLRITTRQASVLNRVIQLGQAAVLKPLWAYLESPDAGAMAIIARWAGDEDAERWKALVQVEAGHLTSENVTRVVELIDGPTDRLRLRAALALHGPTPHTRNPNRRWSTSRFSVEAIEAIASHAIRLDYAPPVQSSLHWVECNIHHDNAEALAHWLSDAAARDDSPAHWILEHLESIEGSLVPALLESLPSAPPGLQRTLLLGLARLAHIGSIPKGLEASLQTAVTAIPQTIRQQVRVVPAGAVTYLKVAQAAAASPHGARLETARSMIEKTMHWLDDDCLSGGTSCLSRLRDIGDGLYISLEPNGYWTRANEAAASLAENEDVLRLLLSWGESMSLAEGSDARMGHLLTAVEAVAQLSPNAFAALADPDVWEPILTEWAETADRWTARLASVRLLGLLRRVTERVAIAFRAAMNDVSFVQQAAYDTVGEFRRMKGDIIPDLLGLLDDPSASVAASTARLLVSLARGDDPTVDRRQILRGLQEAATNSPKTDSVYLMQELEGDNSMEIQFVSRLDQILYSAIFEVSGF